MINTDINTIDWPQTRVVSVMTGSLPMGDTVQNSPIFAFEETPSFLKFDTQIQLNPKLENIDLGGLLAFSIENVVTHEEADAIVATSEYFGFRDEAPGIRTPPGMRMNKSVHWLADESLMGSIMRRISSLLPPEIDGARLYKEFSHRMNMYRYDQGDVFNRHIDGDWPAYRLSEDRSEMLEHPSLRSYLTMLLYLNGPEDGVVGGSTKIMHANGSWVEVTPKKGSALFFRHGLHSKSVVHMGDRVLGQTPKYVARINVLYE
jgi:hypothetical protein